MNYNDSFKRPKLAGRVTREARHWWGVKRGWMRLRCNIHMYGNITMKQCVTAIKVLLEN